MQVVCLDLEGVLIPEIWIEFSKRTGIPEFMRTTRAVPMSSTSLVCNPTKSAPAFPRSINGWSSA